MEWPTPRMHRYVPFLKAWVLTLWGQRIKEINYFSFKNYSQSIFVVPQLFSVSTNDRLLNLSAMGVLLKLALSINILNYRIILLRIKNWLWFILYLVICYLTIPSNNQRSKRAPSFMEGNVPQSPHGSISQKCVTSRYLIYVFYHKCSSSKAKCCLPESF